MPSSLSGLICTISEIVFNQSVWAIPVDEELDHSSPSLRRTTNAEELCKLNSQEQVLTG